MEPEPTPGEWEALYHAADAFYAFAPWRMLSDTDLFAVVDPEDPQRTGFGCVMGQGGEFFGFMLYLGPKGLSGYLALAEDMPFHDGDLPHIQYGILAPFLDRRDLDRTDLAVIRRLGRNYRGHNTWPRFRFHEPGFLPWYLTGPQARFLTAGLEQAVAVGRLLERDPDRLTRADPGKVLTRYRNGEGEWATSWRSLTRYAARVHGPDPVAALLRKAPKPALSLGPAWEVEVFYAPALVQERRDQRPYSPRMLLAVDHNSGLVVDTWMAEHPGEGDTAAVAHLLQQWTTTGVAPERLLVRNPDMMGLLRPLADFLGLSIELGNMPGMDAARNTMAQQMNRGGF